MKKVVLSIVLGLAFSMTILAQSRIPDNFVTYEQIKTVKTKYDAGELIQDGITHYTASNGAVIKVGDKFRISRPEGGSKVFASITNKPTVADVLLNENFNSSVYTTMANTEITVKSITIVGSKKLGFKAQAVLATCGTCNNLLVDIELAIETKEVRAYGVMSSDEALTALKAEKDKLDLGLITQEQYDNRKTELAKFIK